MAGDSRLFHERKLTFARYGLSVEVDNIDDRTSRDELTKYVAHTKPILILMNTRPHSLSAEELQQRIRKLLETCGKVIQMTVSKSSTKGNVQASVQFSNAHEAFVAARRLDSINIHPDSEDKLCVRQDILVELCLFHDQLDAVGSQFHAAAQRFHADHDIVVTVNHHSLDSILRFVKVICSNRKSVAHVKMEIETLVAGTVATVDEEPISDPHYFSAEALPWLHSFMSRYNVWIIVDQRHMVLRMFGDDASICAAQNALISSQILLHQQPKIIVSGPTEYASTISGGWKRNEKLLDEGKAKIIYTPESRRILLASCKDGESHKTQKTLNSINGHVTEVLQCVVCLWPAQSPTRISCGQDYCLNCLISHVVSAT
ncbi:hypothetical protein J1614_003176 [Plenodomus biglobosus]|nr:hypothetical protein J1614_003176 [Plenodomus biglobosus]